MATPAIAKELLELERQYWQAIKEKDVDTAMRLTDEECIVTGAQGVGRMSRQGLSDMMKSAPYTLHAFELKDAEVHSLRDDVAVLGYKVHEELTVDGMRVELDAADASTWVRRGDRWLCALHTEAIAGDPFGRDRRSGSLRHHEPGAFALTVPLIQSLPQYSERSPTVASATSTFSRPFAIFCSGMAETPDSDCSRSA